MAIPGTAETWLVGTTASANSTTTVVPTVRVPDNCHTAIIYNPDGTNTVYAAIGAASGGAALAATASVHVPPGGSLTLGMGAKSQRANVYSAATQLVFSTSAGAITVSLTYVCGRSK